MSPVLSYVVITAPTAATARFYQLKMDFLSTKMKELEFAKCVCVSDPEGHRIGSGGGTLNALAALIAKEGEDKVLGAHVAIIHSGGDSRRSPLQSVCGKAWSSLNCGMVSGDEGLDEEGGGGVGEICLHASPLTVLLRELGDIIARLPTIDVDNNSGCSSTTNARGCTGSILVASSDVLVSLELPKSFIFSNAVLDAVTVITVPETVTVARNHGVVGGCNLEASSGLKDRKCGGGHSRGGTRSAIDCREDVQVFPVECYLQKPSPLEMKENDVLLNCEVNDINSRCEAQPGEDQLTLIDTGLVLICGHAMQRMIMLLQDPAVIHCTFHILSSPSYHATSDMNPLRLELYSDILHALALNNAQANSFNSYLTRLGVAQFDGWPVNALENDDAILDKRAITASLYERALLALWRSMRDCKLVGVCCAKGAFCHLGTSLELQQLLLSPHQLHDQDTLQKSDSSNVSCPVVHVTNGIQENDTVGIKSKLLKLDIFRKKYNLQANVHGLIHDTSGSALSPRSCIVNSIIALRTNIDSQSAITIGSESVIENSFLHGHCRIGSMCFVSGVQPALGQDLVLPSRILLQQVPLTGAWHTLVSSDMYVNQGLGGSGEGDDGTHCVLLTLGMCDDVKAIYSPERRDERGTFCGTVWGDIFGFTGGLVGPADIWDSTCTERSLWTAQLFPVICLTETESLSRQRSMATWFWDAHRASTSSVCETSDVAKLVEEWRSSPRLSMSHLLKCGSAEAMAHWKLYILGAFSDIRRIVPPITTSNSISNLPSLKNMDSLTSLQFSETFTRANSLLQVVKTNLACATLDKKYSERRLEQEAASISLALLVVFFCGSPEIATPIRDDDEVANLLCHHVSLFDCDLSPSYIYPPSDGPSTMGGVSSSCSVTEKLSLQRILRSTKHCYQAIFDNDNFSEVAGLSHPTPADATNPTSWLFGYILRQVDLHGPSGTLLGILKFCSCDSSAPLRILPAKLPRFILLLRLMSNFRIVVLLPTTTSIGISTLLSHIESSIKALPPQCTSLGRAELYINQGSRLVMSNLFDIICLRHLARRDAEQTLCHDAFITIMQQLVRFHLDCSSAFHTHALLVPTVPRRTFSALPLRALYDSLYLAHKSVASAPFRIDLAGGWSDTPPITYECAGNVVNLAVDILDYDDNTRSSDNVDTRAPAEQSLHCSADFIAEPIIRLTTRMKSAASFSTGGATSREFDSHTVTCRSLEDFKTSGCDSAEAIWMKPGALLRVCILAMGILSPLPTSSAFGSEASSLATALCYRCGGYGLHLRSSSSVPVGSGMGSSSILIAVVIRAIWQLLQSSGLNIGLPDVEGQCGALLLVDLVGRAEQLLHTGGGWQDQVGGIYGGLKSSVSSGVLPLNVRVQQISIHPVLHRRLEQRMFLVYSGVARVARGTLLDVLGKFAMQPSGREGETKRKQKTTAMTGIISNACSLQLLLQSRAASECHTQDQADAVVDDIAAHVEVYWEQKKSLAGGTETIFLRNLLSRLNETCAGVSACGAGAGGFVVCFLRRGVNVKDLAKVIKCVREEVSAAEPCSPQTMVSLHAVKINMSGVVSSASNGLNEPVI